MTDEQLLNRKFCCFIGNINKLYRNEFISKLSKYKQVDIINHTTNDYALNNIKDDKGFESKIDFVSQYKFTIAFENTKKLGYITEKPIDAFLSHSALIYFGDTDTFNNDFNWDQKLLVVDENNFDDVINHVIYLDTHDDQYLNLMHKQVLDVNKIEQYTNNLCKFIHRVYDKRNQEDISND